MTKRRWRRRCGNKQIAGAGLDVWSKEPPRADHPLLKFDNVIASPHTAGVTREARANMAQFAAEQLVLDARRQAPSPHRQSGRVAGLRQTIRARLRHPSGGLKAAMISKFHVLYVGQIELDNIGLNGTPANDRRYTDEQLRQAFFTARDVAQTMDELGFDVLWTAEHHFQREGYEVFPNLIQLGLWLATQTKRLKFGCAFNVLPMWHPIRLAEDYAMADIVTDGRVIMGVGRGYHTREVESFGAPLLDAERTANCSRSSCSSC